MLSKEDNDWVKTCQRVIGALQNEMRWEQKDLGRVYVTEDMRLLGLLREDMMFLVAIDLKDHLIRASAGHEQM
jgi:hypothetical protein